MVDGRNELTENSFKEQAQNLYDQILGVANHFLHSSKRFSVELLASENPSYEELADIMEKVAKIVGVLADEFDPMMGQKAIEYASLMRRMALAINAHDQVLLSALTAELDRRPFL